MFYYSIDSKEKVVHFERCYHLKKIKSSNLRTFKSTNDFRKSEYRICCCCSPIVECLRKEQNELENYCLNNGLSYFLQKGNLHICTHNSQWKVLISNKNNNLELHHQNCFDKEHDDSVPGYHKQNFTSDSILGFFKYIDKHEHYRMTNPLYVPSKKEMPKKGTKRYRKQQKSMKRKHRKEQIWNVISLIDGLSTKYTLINAL